MAESNDTAPHSSISSPKKDCLFWSKILATQYLIRHPFWKSFSVPIIIGQISFNSSTE
jgi:hypothetical protein